MLGQEAEDGAGSGAEAGAVGGAEAGGHIVAPSGTDRLFGLVAGGQRGWMDQRVCSPTFQQSNILCSASMV